MLKFFRLYDPYRLFAIAIMLILLRLSWLLGFNPITLPDLHHLLVGEKLGDGFFIYSELKTNTAPLSALIYYLLDFFFGRSILAYYILSIALILLQAILLNGIFASNRVFRENSNYPALAYILFANVFFGFATLSPIVIALLFLLLALQKLFKILQSKSGEDSYFSLGFYLGLAVLTDLASFVFILVAIWALIVYSESSAKKVIMMIFGSMFPLIMCALIFFWFDSLALAGAYFTTDVFNIDLKENLNNFLLYSYLLPPAIIITYATLRFIGQRGMNLNQQRFRKTMITWIFMSLLMMIFLLDPLEDGHWFLLIPAVTYFFAGYLNTARKKWLANLIIFLLIIQGVIINYFGVFNQKGLPSTFGWEQLQIQPKNYDVNPNKTILYLGEGLSEYAQNKSGSVFMSHRITEKLLSQSNNYEAIEEIQRAFELERPDVIIDPSNLMEPIFDRIPSLKLEYQKKETGIWERKNP
ncbi:DUF6427 family protein [Peijinzhouia sedimentorum]